MGGAGRPHPSPLFCANKKMPLNEECGREVYEPESGHSSICSNAAAAERLPPARVRDLPPAALEKLSMHVDNVSRPRLLVKVIYVLADEKEVLQCVFNFGEREVRRSRFGC